MALAVNEPLPPIRTYDPAAVPPGIVPVHEKSPMEFVVAVQKMVPDKTAVRLK